MNTHLRHTKMVCTIGPASASSHMIKALIRAGMNVARLNFSHGTHDEHGVLIKRIREATKTSKQIVGIVADLQGPKIRLGILPKEGVHITMGEKITFSTHEHPPQGCIPVTYASLHKEVKPHDRIFLDDGTKEVKVTSVSGRLIHAEVVTGGILTSHKGMNFPDTKLSVSALSSKDRKDLAFAVEHQVDWIALSFVTHPKEITDARKLIKKACDKKQIPPRILVKIEKPAALLCLNELIAEADGVIVARGDLGVEIDPALVPVKQQEIIDVCHKVGKPVIVATQMLDSMIRNPQPTRAEVSDVARAVFAKADATMLSGETASGEFPLAAASMMVRVIESVENSAYHRQVPTCYCDASDQLHHLSCVLSTKNLPKPLADAVILRHDDAPWGESLLLEHPDIPLFLATSSKTIAAQTVLRWGVHPVVTPSTKRPSDTLKAVAKQLPIVKHYPVVAIVPGNNEEEITFVQQKSSRVS